MVAQLLLAMAAVLGSWIVAGAVLAGLGLGLRRIFGLRQIQTLDLFVGFFLGLAIALLLLQLWHLNWRIDWRAAALIGAPGLAGIVTNAAELWRWLRRPRSAWRWFAAALVALWLANRALGAAETYDSGLYQLSAVRWATQFAIVPGLANLHGRLGFNNSHLLLGALLESGPWQGRSSHLLNGLLLLPLLLMLAGSSLFGLFGSPAARRPRHVFVLVLLTPILFMAFSADVSSPSTDLPVAAVGFAAALVLFNVLTERADAADDRAFHVLSLVAMLAAAVCAKLSAAVFAAATALLAVAVWMYHDRPARRLATRTLAWSVALGAAMIVPWMMRGIMLSGYPLYPMTFAAADIEWRVPREQAQQEHQAIRLWARQYYEKVEQERPDWLGEWVRHLPSRARFDVVLPLGLSALAVVVMAARAVGGACESSIVVRVMWVAVPVVVSMVFWFVTAPAPRFGAFLFWILAATLWAATLGGCLDLSRRRVAVAALLIAALPALLLVQRRVAYYRREVPDEPLFSALVHWPGPDHGFHPAPRGRLTTFVTDCQLTLYVPADPGEDRCWDAPLPCTPYPRAELCLRQKHDLSSGFVLDQ